MLKLARASGPERGTKDRDSGESESRFGFPTPDRKSRAWKPCTSLRLPPLQILFLFHTYYIIPGSDALFTQFVAQSGDEEETRAKAGNSTRRGRRNPRDDEINNNNSIK